MTQDSWSTWPSYPACSCLTSIIRQQSHRWHAVSPTTSTSLAAWWTLPGGKPGKNTARALQLSLQPGHTTANSTAFDWCHCGRSRAYPVKAAGSQHQALSQKLGNAWVHYRVCQSLGENTDFTMYFVSLPNNILLHRVICFLLSSLFPGQGKRNSLFLLFSLSSQQEQKFNRMMKRKKVS